MTKTISGIASSAGITIAKAYLLKHHNKASKTANIFSVEQEISRLNEAISIVSKELDKLQSNTHQKENASKFNIHLLILDDYDLIDQIKSRILYENNNAEKAWSNVTKKYINMFEQMNTDYMKVRAQAIRDVTQRILYYLGSPGLSNFKILSEPVILIADDISSTDIVQFNLKYITGIVTNNGTNTSDFAITARSMGIPAVVGTKCITSEIYDGVDIILDGIDGKVIIDPSIDNIKEYSIKLNHFNGKNHSDGYFALYR